MVLREDESSEDGEAKLHLDWRDVPQKDRFGVSVGFGLGFEFGVGLLTRIDTTTKPKHPLQPSSLETAGTTAIRTPV